MAAVSARLTAPAAGAQRPLSGAAPASTTTIINASGMMLYLDAGCSQALPPGSAGNVGTDAAGNFAFYFTRQHILGIADFVGTVSSTVNDAVAGVVVNAGSSAGTFGTFAGFDLRMLPGTVHDPAAPLLVQVTAAVCTSFAGTTAGAGYTYTAIQNGTTLPMAFLGATVTNDGLFLTPPGGVVAAVGASRAGSGSWAPSTHINVAVGAMLIPLLSPIDMDVAAGSQVCASDGVHLTCFTSPTNGTVGYVSMSPLPGVSYAATPNC